MKAMPTQVEQSKMFAKKVNRVLVGFEDSKQFLAGIGHVVVTGNPTKVKKKRNNARRKEEHFRSDWRQNELTNRFGVWRKSRSQTH